MKLTYVSVAWAWQSVYDAGRSEVAVPEARTRYSVAPTMQYLSHASVRGSQCCVFFFIDAYWIVWCIWHALIAVMAACLFSGGLESAALAVAITAARAKVRRFHTIVDSTSMLEHK